MSSESSDLGADTTSRLRAPADCLPSTKLLYAPADGRVQWGYSLRQVDPEAVSSILYREMPERMAQHQLVTPSQQFCEEDPQASERTLACLRDRANLSKLGPNLEATPRLSLIVSYQ